MADDDKCSECARGYPPELIQGFWLHLQTCLKGEVGTFPCRDRLDDTQEEEEGEAAE